MRICTMPPHSRTTNKLYILVSESDRRLVLHAYWRLRRKGLNSNWARWTVVDLLGAGMESNYDFSCVE